MSKEETIVHLFDRGFCCERYRAKETARLDKETLHKISTSCCMCEPVTAQSLGDDAHAVVKWPKWASEHGPTHIGVVQCVGGAASLAHRYALDTRTRAEVNVRSRPLEDKQQAPDNNERKRENRCLRIVHKNTRAYNHRHDRHRRAR